MPRRYYRRFRRRRTGGIAKGIMYSMTGGTRDMNPQWMHFITAQSAADTAAIREHALPVTRIPSRGKVVIIELIKFSGNFADYGFTSGVAAQHMNFLLRTSSAIPTSYGLGLPGTFMAVGYRADGNANGAYSSPNQYEYDFTDGAGHGLLVASDKIYSYLHTQATGATNNMYWGLLYRFKAVTMTEYVGIVQGQQ